MSSGFWIFESLFTIFSEQGFKTGFFIVQETGDRKKNIEIIIEEGDVSTKDLVIEKSKDAALTLIGFRGDTIKHGGDSVFSGYDDMGTILFVNSHDKLEID